MARELVRGNKRGMSKYLVFYYSTMSTKVGLAEYPPPTNQNLALTCFTMRNYPSPHLKEEAKLEGRREGNGI